MMTPSIPALPDDLRPVLAELLNRLEAKQPRNQLRLAYYDGKYRFEDLLISTPPRLRDQLTTVLDWPAKAVDLLSQRIRVEDFVTPGGDDFGLSGLWSENRMDVKAPQAHDSALIHSCAFIWTTMGGQGEPAAVINLVSAQNGTALIDPVTLRPSAALRIVDRSVDQGEPVSMVMATADRIVMLDKNPVGSRWSVEVLPHGLGRVPVEPIVYRPNLERPFGRSRISRPIMSLTQSALRTVIRSEVGAEFFAAPRIAALNMPTGTEMGWDALINRALVVDAPAADDMDADPAWQPSIQQLAQVSMQPHVDQLRMFATMFASAATLPLDAVGIVQDNPSSAEAIEKAEKNLTGEAERTGRVFGSAWSQAMINAWCLANGTADRSALSGLRAVIRDPRMPSKAAAADAMLKQVSTPGLEWIGQTEVALEQLGYDRPTIERLLSERRRAEGTGALATLLARQQQPETTPEQ